MNDPYSVLGVSPNSTDDQIKSAYRELAKKYHPDAYANNPLADLAAEKMKEINQAYDEVMKMRSTGGSAGYDGSSSGYENSSDFSGDSSFHHVRELINAGRLEQAELILNRTPMRQRTAEWYFLKGSVMYRRGWVNEAYSNYQSAVNMDPNNPEYKQAYDTVASQMNGGFYNNRNFGGYNNGNPGGCSGCDVCSALLCADCLCNNGGCC